jgi:hypothetical protein
MMRVRENESRKTKGVLNYTWRTRGVLRMRVRKVYKNAREGDRDEVLRRFRVVASLGRRGSGRLDEAGSESAKLSASRMSEGEAKDSRSSPNAIPSPYPTSCSSPSTMTQSANRSSKTRAQVQKVSHDPPDSPFATKLSALTRPIILDGMPLSTTRISRSSWTVRVHVDTLQSEELVLERLPSRVPLARVEREHMLEQIERFRHTLSMLLGRVVWTVVRVQVGVGGKDDGLERVAGVVEGGDVGEEGSV